jgi:hypothetical protein
VICSFQLSNALLTMHFRLSPQLMPSPKWKLVVDIGDLEETTTVPISTVAGTTNTAAADAAPSSTDVAGYSTSTLNNVGSSTGGSMSSASFAPTPSGITAASAAFAPQSVTTAPNVDLPETNIPDSAVAVAALAVAAASSAPEAASGPGYASASYPSAAAGLKTGKDPRVDTVVSLLGEFMPSSPQSPLAPYVPGFMSLRLLLLRQARSPEDEDLVRTMLDSFSSYATGGRQRQDIALMLARDFMFVSQQLQMTLQQQQNPFLCHDNNLAAAASSSNAGLQIFHMPLPGS